MTVSDYNKLVSAIAITLSRLPATSTVELEAAITANSILSPHSGYGQKTVA
jgi:hypothetical protein